MRDRKHGKNRGHFEKKAVGSRATSIPVGLKTQLHPDLKYKYGAWETGLFREITFVFTRFFFSSCVLFVWVLFRPLWKMRIIIVLLPLPSPPIVTAPIFPSFLYCKLHNIFSLYPRRSLAAAQFFSTHVPSEIIVRADTSIAVSFPAERARNLLFTFLILYYHYVVGFFCVFFSFFALPLRCTG